MDDKEIPRKTYSELIFEQLKEIKTAMREDKQSGDTRHSQILTGTTISIALAVIYSILK